MREKRAVVFVEGETDKVFYRMFMKFIIDKYKLSIPLDRIIIYCVKGIGNYKSAPNIFKGRIKRDNPDIDFYVVCSYDTDAFEGSYVGRPRVDWKDVEKNLRKQHAIDVIHIKAVHCIEDWFLIDKDGLCKFLKIKVPKKLSGKNGFEKISRLFKTGNKTYFKGYYADKFLDCLDLDMIYDKLKGEFDPLISILKKL